VFGAGLIALAIAMPFIGSFAGDLFVQHVMVTDPVPQNAMVLAFLGWCVSIVVALVIGATGGVLFWFARRTGS
jgi:hypothetical protein